MLNWSLLRSRGEGFGYRRDEGGRAETAFGVTEAHSPVEPPVYRAFYEFVNFFSVDEIGWLVAWLVLPQVSFKRIGIEPLTSCSPPRKFNLFGCRRDERGQLELDKRVSSLIGLLILALALSAGNWLIQTAL